MTLKIIISQCFIFFLSLSILAQSFKVESPDGNIELNVKLDSGLYWSVNYKGQEIIKKSKVSMSFVNGMVYGHFPKIENHNIKSISNEIHPAIAHKDAVITDEYNELKITFQKQYGLTFRIYDDGLAYRFSDRRRKDRKVVHEQMTVSFPEGTKSLFPKEVSMYSHNERNYLRKSLEEIDSEDFCSLPVMFTTDETKVLFTESSLHNYPGMFIKGNGDNTINSLFPKYATTVIPDRKQPDRSQIITEEADYMAAIKGPRHYPWRIFIVSDDDKTFVESNLTFQLAQTQAIDDTDWIRPGKVAWDWYNANNITGTSFESGLNTATYKYFIDFASSKKIEYVILDEGWTKSTTEILDFNPNMDVLELIRYGKEKGVELILWVLWKPLDEDLDTILQTYRSWGVKGVKVDFMQRNDQYMVSSYERIAKKCAEMKLIVDFHGSFKPSGLRRKYPNVINYEGVRGAENNKWSSEVTPTHNVTIPFTRMAAGPMDYTPGAMANAHLKNHKISFDRPMSLGTRAHQVAMYVVYEAPLQMLCDSPSRYYKEQETVDFIVQIPTTWDETTVLHGSIGNHIAIARRKGDKWYIGAMTNEEPRKLDIDFSFLGKGSFQLQIFKDGLNAHRMAEDYALETLTVTNLSNITAEMVSGGGWAAIITK